MAQPRDVFNLYDIQQALEEINILAATGTITLCEQGENHVGMQKMGQMAPDGFNLMDLARAQTWFLNRGVTSDIYDLKRLLPLELRPVAEDAYLLYIPRGANSIVDMNAFKAEQDALPKDTHAFMYGRVVNKMARHNLCFDTIAQEPDYQNKKGRIVAFDQVPLLNTLRNTLPQIIGPKANNLVAEGNYYYDITKCGIGFHGDAERRRVIAVRFGESMPLDYQWFYQSKPVGDRCSLQLHNGDMYIMSEKAVGTDWKLRNTLTLRHAAGAAKYRTIKNK